MTSLMPARRRAEEFAALVEGRGAPADARHGDLLELVTAMRTTPAAEPRAAYVADLRSRLMLEADEALAGHDPKLALPVHTKTRRDRRVAIAAGAAALVGATSSMAVAAQTALPGDALYPVKRALESAETSLQADDLARADQMLTNAADRLSEASALAERHTAESVAALPSTIDDFSDQALTATDLVLDGYARTGDQDAVEALRDFTAESMDALAELDGVIPDLARDELNRAALVLSGIDQRAAAACLTCGGGLLEIPEALLLAFQTGQTVLPTAPGASSITQIAPAPELRKPKTASQAPADGAGIADQEQAPQVQVPLDALGEGATSGRDRDGSTSDDDSSPTLGDLTDVLVRGGDKKSGSDDGLLDPVLEPLEPVTDPLLDAVTGEDGLLSP